MTLNVHKFAAIKGRQSGDDYYTVVCEMAIIPRLFLFNEATIPTELRAQRHINKSRIPEIARYIVDNPKNYIFPSEKFFFLNVINKSKILPFMLPTIGIFKKYY